MYAVHHAGYDPNTSVEIKMEEIFYFISSSISFVISLVATQTGPKPRRPSVCQSVTLLHCASLLTSATQLGSASERLTGSMQRASNKQRVTGEQMAGQRVAGERQAGERVAGEREIGEREAGEREAGGSKRGRVQ